MSADATLVGVKVSEILRLIGRDGVVSRSPEGKPSPVQAPEQAGFGNGLGQAKPRSSPQDARQYLAEPVDLAAELRAMGLM
jgi:hypothetical protein